VRRAEVKETVVGAVAFLTLAGALAVSYTTGSVPAGAGYRVDAMFNRIDGLRVGDDVQLGGVKIGAVEAVALTEDFRARVRLRVDPRVELPSDTAAAIHTAGLFGSKHVVLDPGGEERLLVDGDVISFTQDAVVVTELLDLIIAEAHARRGTKPNSGN